MDTSIALVTGASKGIGLEIARQLAAAGNTVYVGARDTGRGKQAVAEIGADSRLLVLDVTDARSIAEAARRRLAAVSTYRRISVPSAAVA